MSDLTQPMNGGEVLTARDTRLIERAVRQGWEIPPEAYKILPREMVKIAIGKNADGTDLTDSDGKKVSTRNRIAAAKAVAAMHGQNQADNPAPQKHEHLIQHEAVVIETAQRYGLDRPKLADRLNGHSGNGHSHNGNGHHV